MAGAESTDDRRDRNVYILGAGFSQPAGAPVVKDFLDTSRALYDDPGSSLTKDQRTHFANVFNFKRAMAPARERFLIDLDNVEELFGLIEISHRLRKDPAPRRDMINLIADTLKLSVERQAQPRRRANFRILGGMPSLLEAAIPRVFTDGGNNYFHGDVYDYFAALVAGLLDHPERRKNRKDSIITLNYDLVCDTAIRKLGLTPNYHLSADADSRQPSSVSLLKLHGSINWMFCPACGQIQVLDNVEPKKAENIPSPGCLNAQCKKRDCELLLVPPSWDKAEHQDIIKEVWSQAVQELRLASRICVIGYSMPKADAFFRYLLTLALSENDRLYSLIVVDRDPSIEARYVEEFDQLFQKRRFKFQGMGVHQFLASRDALPLLGRAELVATIDLLAR